jgi:hypothetical protein
MKSTKKKKERKKEEEDAGRDGEAARRREEKKGQRLACFLLHSPSLTPFLPLLFILTVSGVRKLVRALSIFIPGHAHWRSGSPAICGFRRTQHLKLSDFGTFRLVGVSKPCNIPKAVDVYKEKKMKEEKDD